MRSVLAMLSINVQHSNTYEPCRNETPTPARGPSVHAA